MPLKKVNLIPRHFSNINAFVLAGNRTIFLPKDNSKILQASFSKSATNLAVKNYKNLIHNTVKSNRVYPSRDRRRGKEGNVTAQFTVLRNGSIKNLKLISSATSNNINRAAITAIKESTPLKAFPIGIGGKTLNVIIPFSFRINKF